MTIAHHHLAPPPEHRPGHRRTATGLTVALTSCTVVALSTIWGWITDDPIDVAGPARTAVNRAALVGSFGQGCVTRWLTATQAHAQSLADCWSLRDPMRLPTTPAVVVDTAAVSAVTLETDTGTAQQWSVVVSVSERPYESATPAPTFYRLPVVYSAYGVRASALPARITGPGPGADAPLGYPVTLAAANPAFSTVAGFLTAYLTDAGGLDRYVTADSGLLPAADHRSATLTKLLAQHSVPDEGVPPDGTEVQVLATVDAVTTAIRAATRGLPDHPDRRQRPMDRHRTRFRAPARRRRRTHPRAARPALTRRSPTMTTVLAATDLMSGSRSLYTIGVTVLVILILLAGGFRAARRVPRRPHGTPVGWALVASSSPSSSDPATPSTSPPNAPPTKPASPPGNSGNDRVRAAVLRGARHPRLHRRAVQQTAAAVGGRPAGRRRGADRRGHPAALDGGHARAVLITGLSITAAAAGAGALVPRGRPTLGFRAPRRMAHPAAENREHHRAPTAGPTHRRDRQPALHRPRRLRRLSAHRTCATTCNPPNAASASPNATAPWCANCPPAHGSTASPSPKTSAACCAPCSTGTATAPTGSRPAASCSRSRRENPHTGCTG